MSQIDIILKKAMSLKGSHEFDNYCQRFVRVCYEAAGISGSAASAKEAYGKWAISKDEKNIPAGAAVYFKGFGEYGHVGIASGNGNVIHAANGVRVQDFAYCNKKYKFLGWGWHGGNAPSGADLKTAEKAEKNIKSGEKTKTKSGKTVKSKAIEQIAVKNIGGGYKDSIFGSIDTLPGIENGYELLIENDAVYLPTIAGAVTLEYKRQLAPATLRFNVLKDERVDFGGGSPVRFRVNGKDIFRGYVFEKSRQERDIISVTAYDSLRYFKNRDTILYRNKKYSDLLKMLINDYRLSVGDIADTGYVIEKQLEEGAIFDILANAADITYTQTGKRYVLLDDFGKICLRGQEDMQTDVICNADNTGHFDYKSTIDKEVYDYVQVVMDNKAEGVRNVYTMSDSNTAIWGRLQCYLKPNEELNAAQARELAKKVLKQYSRKRRYLSLYDVKGDIAVRGGSIVGARFDLGDIKINEGFICERVLHTFDGMQHLMDIDLYGREGEFDV